MLGPYTVVDKVSRVTYRVSKGDGHPVKLAHINNLKVYQDRVLSVNAVTLMAEEQGIGDDLLANKAVLSKDRCPGYNETKWKTVLSELDMYFSVNLISSLNIKINLKLYLNSLDSGGSVIGSGWLVHE